MAMNKSLTINMGNCNHRKYLPHLVELVRTGAAAPSALSAQVQTSRTRSTPTAPSTSANPAG